MVHPNNIHLDKFNAVKIIKLDLRITQKCKNSEREKSKKGYKY